MVIRNPLVIVSGVSSQLPPTDTVPGTDAIAQASGNAALAIGSTALASGNAALIVGSVALASGNAAQVTANSASNLAVTSAALATAASASGNAALVLSTDALASGTSAQTSASVALSSGNAALIVGSNALASGFEALASGNAALIIGSTALSSGNAALVSVLPAQASGNAALIVAGDALASGNAALLLPSQALASGNAALVISQDALASGNAALVLGVAALPAAGGTLTGSVANTASGYISVPVGSSAQRPSVPASGMLRYNTTSRTYEAYSEESWGSIPTQSGPLAGYRNAIINGNFDLWQRGTSFSSAVYGADRWVNSYVGSSAVMSQQTFTPGTFNGSPRLYCRMVVTSVTGVGNFSSLVQRIEGVRTFAGQKVTLSFWVKPSAPLNISSEFVQFFGTGGSPSASVTSIGVNKFSLVADWQKVSCTVTIPSITGKTLGSNADDYLILRLWMDAGSSFNSQTNSLGHQSGTFEFSQVQVEPGVVATDFEERSLATEWTLAQRYYQLISANEAGYVTGTVSVSHRATFATIMRSAPTVTYDSYSGAGGAPASYTLTSARDGVVIQGNATSAYSYSMRVLASAEL